MTINEIRSEMYKHLCAKIGQLDCIRPVDVIAWMPLPEPYKEKS